MDPKYVFLVFESDGNGFRGVFSSRERAQNYIDRRCEDYDYPKDMFYLESHKVDALSGE